MKKFFTLLLLFWGVTSNSLNSIENSVTQNTANTSLLSENSTPVDSEFEKVQSQKNIAILLKMFLIKFSVFEIENTLFISTKVKCAIYASIIGSMLFDIADRCIVKEKKNLKVNTPTTKNKLYNFVRCITDIPAALFFGTRSIAFFYLGSVEFLKR